MYITLESFINRTNENNERNEIDERKLTLYHGTCLENTKNLIKNGWSPRSGCSGSNCGDSRYLYLSSGYEDALWFAEEKACNSVVQISDIPLSYLKPYPEDEAGYTMKDLLDRIDTEDYPSKFALTTALDSSYFKMYEL